MAKRSKSSKKWLAEHFSDVYVKKAKAMGYRSRAIFKLQELLQKDPLLQKNMAVVDLGAAPGGWSEWAAQVVGPQGKVWACDILPMDPIANVTFIQGDFTAAETFDALLNSIGNNPIQVILSDMAPNMSGVNAVDQPRAIYLAELALEMCEKLLSSDGAFIVKTFQGEGYEALLREVRQKFQKVVIRKPESSRKRSSEVYLVAKGFKGRSESE